MENLKEVLLDLGIDKDIINVITPNLSEEQATVWLQIIAEIRKKNALFVLAHAKEMTSGILSGYEDQWREKAAVV